MTYLDSERLTEIVHKYNVSYPKTYDLCLYTKYRLVYKSVRVDGLVKSLGKDYAGNAIDLVDRYYRMKSYRGAM